jgi:hypothetical protein
VFRASGSKGGCAIGGDKNAKKKKLGDGRKTEKQKRAKR